MEKKGGGGRARRVRGRRAGKADRKATTRGGEERVVGGEVPKKGGSGIGAVLKVQPELGGGGGTSGRQRGGAHSWGGGGRRVVVERPETTTPKIHSSQSSKANQKPDIGVMAEGRAEKEKVGGEERGRGNGGEKLGMN